MYNNKKVLVTGGMGFIGSHLARKLIEQGALVTITTKSMLGQEKMVLDSILDKITVIEADIREEKRINALVKDAEYIFDLAGRSGAVNSWDDPLMDLDINCKGHLILLEACRKYNLKAKLIFPGTRLEFGPPIYLPVDENHPLNPQSIHAVHKLTVEKYCLAYFHKYGIRTAVLRISNPYGAYDFPGQRTYNIINNFIWRLMEGKKVSIFGDGSQIRDYIYIDDLIDLMLRVAAQDEYWGEVFNIGNGKPIKLIDMVKTIIKVVGKGEYECIPWPESYAKVETGNYVTDIQKVKMFLGWEPKICIEEGIKKTVQFLRKKIKH